MKGEHHEQNRSRIGYFGQFASEFAGGFDADGNVTDEKIKSNLAAQMQALQEWALRLSPKA